MTTDPKQLRAAAKAKRIGLTKLCKLAGVNPATFWRWERGRSVPLVSTISKLNAAIAEANECPTMNPQTLSEGSSTGSQHPLQSGL